MLGQQVDALAVFLYGTASFFTPCVLPMVPAFLAGLTGGRLDDRRSVVIAAGLFVVGFTLVFMMMGATAGLIGQFLLRHRAAVRWVSGGILILLGLFMTGVFGPLMQREYRMNIEARGLGRHARAVALGGALALGWTPCTGPALGAALTLAARSATAWRGVGLLLAYSLGLGVPFMVTAGFMQALAPVWRRLAPKLPLVQRVAGGLLITLGVLQWTGWLSLLPS